MSSVPYLLLVGKVTRIGALVTVLTNTLLIYLTYFHIKSITGVYKVTIYLLAVFGILFSIVEFIAQPFVHFFDNSVMYFSTDDMFGAPLPVKTGFLLAYSCLYATFLCLIAIQFFYRFCVITHSKMLALFEKKHYQWLMAYVTVCVGIWGAGSLKCLPDQFSMDYVKEELMKEYGSKVEETPGFFIVTYELQNFTQHFHIPSLICALCCAYTLILQYSIIIFCGLRIRSKMSEAKHHMSEKSHQMQRQLFRTLILQILTPSIFHHIPVLMMLLTVFLDVKFRIPFGIMFCFFSFFPAIDSGILMVLVVEYREIVKNFFKVVRDLWLRCHQDQRRVGEVTTRSFDLSRSNHVFSTTMT